MSLCLCDIPAVVSDQDGQTKPLFSGMGRYPWAQIYAKATNIGTVWIGGASVGPDRGIPIYKGGSMFIPLSTPQFDFMDTSTVCLYFEKAGDAVCGVFAKFGA